MNNGLKLVSPTWEDYELVDSGDFEKLERFGRYLLRRPEPQAIWRKSLSEEEWQRMADGSFRREGRDEERGGWSLRRGMVEQWRVAYPLGGHRLVMRLGLTSFKHVGLVPEQADNWEFIYKQVTELGRKLGRAPRVLNLFAYTGGASLAAAAAGADVTHVDSVRQVVTWARENMEQSGLNGIRWVVEDALKFVRREVKRGHHYDGIILDPPAYGRGPDGEKWVLEQNIGEMLSCCAQLLESEGGFAVLNLYSMGLSAMLARSAMCQLFPKASTEQFGELYFTDRFAKSLPLGVYYRATYTK
ncbi:MAG: class I SAM-dependent methyltransferase [Tidjanibacter sp.]|nr:class I SAM-dependent methyltransferase [Tidjanibacter sp.]